MAATPAASIQVASVLVEVRGAALGVAAVGNGLKADGGLVFIWDSLHLILYALAI
jgi:hypothetical protein